MLQSAASTRYESRWSAKRDSSDVAFLVTPPDVPWESQGIDRDGDGKINNPADHYKWPQSGREFLGKTNVLVVGGRERPNGKTDRYEIKLAS